MNRRQFLKNFIAAPAIITVAPVMKIWIPKQEIADEGGVLVPPDIALEFKQWFVAESEGHYLDNFARIIAVVRKPLESDNQLRTRLLQVMRGTTA